MCLMCNTVGKYFKINERGEFLFLFTVGRLFVSVSETLRDEHSMKTLLKYPGFQKQNTSLSINCTYF